MQMINKEDDIYKKVYIEAIKVMLKQYSVFQEPKGPPPIRAQDHAINLLPRAKLVFVRPYMYPFFQEEEIEKTVKSCWVLM